MNFEFAKRMDYFSVGIFNQLAEKKKELKKSGTPIYDLSIGTPDFLVSQRIIDAVKEAACDPNNYKYAIEDLPELTQAVQNRYKNRYGVMLASDEIMSVYGSQEGMAHIGFPLFNPGDTILVPNPGYPIFEIGPFLSGAKLEKYPLLKENDFLPDLENIPEHIKKEAKAMIVSYPLNPVCKAAPDSFYKELIAFAKKNNILIIHDNAYSDIIYDGRVGKSFLAFEGAKEIGIEFYSLSKSYNYTGARMSFVVGNASVVAQFKKLRSQIDYGIFLPVQYGAIAALTGPDDGVIAQCHEYEQRRNALCGGLRSIGWNVPDSEGTMFAWGKIPEKYGNDDVAFVMDLMEQTGVIVVPGSSFGDLGKGYVRFALVLPVEKIHALVASIEKSNILN